jgi:hypothetical protein
MAPSYLSDNYSGATTDDESLDERRHILDGNLLSFFQMTQFFVDCTLDLFDRGCCAIVDLRVQMWAKQSIMVGITDNVLPHGVFDIQIVSGRLQEAKNLWFLPNLFRELRGDVQVESASRIESEDIAVL